MYRELRTAGKGPGLLQQAEIFLIIIKGLKMTVVSLGLKFYVQPKYNYNAVNFGPVLIYHNIIVRIIRTIMKICCNLFELLKLQCELLKYN